MKHHRKLQSSDGFTLMETVITVAVLLVLSVGGFLAYQDVRDKAYKANIANAVQQVFNTALMIRDDPEIEPYQPGENAGYRAADWWIKSAKENSGERVRQIDMRGFMIDEDYNLTDNKDDKIVIVAVSNELGFDRDGYPYFEWRSEDLTLTKERVWELIQKQNEQIEAERQQE